MGRFVTATLVVALSLGPGATFAVEDEAPATGAFSRTGSLSEARSSLGVYGAVPLADGRILVMNGGCHARSAPSLEVWDPETGEFSLAGSLATGRCYYTATPLEDGRVLILGGGRSNQGMSPRAQLWDPETGALEAAGKLDPPRVGHTATRLQDGWVLIVGGSSSTDTYRPLASAQVWDPENEQFSPTGPMAHPRSGHTATLLPDGRVLVVGGADGDQRGSAEVWDPATGTFSPTGSLIRPRFEDFSALPLVDGRVLITGPGHDERPLLDEAWDPATGTFATTPTVVWSDYESTATVLPDGRIVVIGGGDEFNGADVWDPATWSSVPAGELIRSRGRHAAALLQDGRVLVVGGDVAAAEVWDPHGLPVPVSEEFERVGLPSVFGNRVGDLIVLDDEGFCSYLLGGIWNRASIVPSDLVLGQSSDKQAVQAAVDANAQFPATDGEMLERCAQTLRRFRTAEPDALAPEWSKDHPVVPQAFASLVTDETTGDDARPRMEPSDRTSLELQMLLGVRDDLQGSCVPRRSDLPTGSIAAIQCTPRAPGIERVRIYLFERRLELMDAYFARLARAGATVSRPHYPQVQGASFVDRTGRAHFLIPSAPNTLFEVIGSGRNAERARLFAHLGNQDQPGGPTLCCDGGSPEK